MLKIAILAVLYEFSIVALAFFKLLKTTFTHKIYPENSDATIDVKIPNNKNLNFKIISFLYIISIKIYTQSQGLHCHNNSLLTTTKKL